MATNNKAEMVLLTDMNEVIEKHLPQQVGKVLVARLEELETTKEELKAANDLLAQARSRAENAEELLRKGKSLDERERYLDEKAQQLKGKEVELDKQAAVFKAVEEMRARTYWDMKELAMSVFSNQQFKYSSEMTGVMPIYNQWGSLEQQPFSAEVTAEGDGAVPPVPPMPAVASPPGKQDT